MAPVVVLVSSLVAGAGLHFSLSERHLPFTQDRSAVAVSPTAAARWSSIEICRGGNRQPRRVTCIVDGDTGWQEGVKWRLYNVDAPELSRPACSNERKKAIAARDRIRHLMSGGYRMEWIGRSGSYGRQLARIRIADGRDAGRVLIEEGLAQPWPNSGNVWCEY